MRRWANGVCGLFLPATSASQRTMWHKTFVCSCLFGRSQNTDNSTRMRKLQSQTVHRQTVAQQTNNRWKDDAKMHVVNPNKQHFGNSLRPLFSLAIIFAVYIVLFAHLTLYMYIISVACFILLFSMIFQCIGRAWNLCPTKSAIVLADLFFQYFVIVFCVVFAFFFSIFSLFPHFVPFLPFYAFFLGCDFPRRCWATAARCHYSH